MILEYWFDNWSQFVQVSIWYKEVSILIYGWHDLDNNYSNFFWFLVFLVSLQSYMLYYAELIYYEIPAPLFPMRFNSALVAIV